MEPLSPSLPLISQLCSILQNQDFPAQLASTIQASKRTCSGKDPVLTNGVSGQRELIDSGLFLHVEASLCVGAPSAPRDGSLFLVCLATPNA
jgi:hypothetical protein